jgi:hypothetical protein
VDQVRNLIGAFLGPTLEDLKNGGRFAGRPECRLRVLVVSKRFGRSRTATFHTSKPFTIISERIVADC